jgi:acid phosphatase (class A)
MRLYVVAGALLLSSLMPLAFPAFAFDPSQTYVQPQFLPPRLLPPPPVEGSAAWRKQADAVLRAQRNITAADMAALRDEQKVRLELITSVVGGSFTREHLPKTFDMLDHVLASAEQIASADKKFWHTRRPYLTDAHVRLFVDPLDASPSYPSGHTADFRVLAEVIGLLVPDKLDALRARADAIAFHRIEAGVHYPGDIEGGRTLAMLVVGSLMASDEFEEDLVAAKKEVAGLNAHK